MSASFLPGTMFLIDTSALARARLDRAVAEIIVGVIDNGMAATCATIDLEMGYSARTPESLRKVMAGRANAYKTLPITEDIAQRARQVQALMADFGLHRAAGAMDLLTAATAEHYRATILHYDADFEHIAKVTGQQQQWVVPRGTVD